jgi:phage terminase large subunit-like protein
MRDRFSVRGVHYDPYQMAAVAQRLSAAGLPMKEYPQTVANLTAMGNNLFELIQAGGIEFYPSPDIRLAISRTIAIETPRGIRLAKDKTSHKIDVVIALAMAAQSAVTGQREREIPVRIMVGFGGLVSNDVIDDDAANWAACQLAASRGELKGSQLAFYYRERARRGLGAAQ